MWKRYGGYKTPKVLIKYLPRKIYNTFENSVCCICMEENITTYNYCENKHTDGMC